MIPTKRPPTHPGEMLLEEFLKPNGISQVAFAKKNRCAIAENKYPD
jgi:plasmid maintenance system antidote protein VapI